MLFPVKQLLEGRGEPLCVDQRATVRDALARMVENDYSQLPIVDAESRLSGLISEQSIVSTYFHVAGSASLLDLTVDHCQTAARTISPESDIFEALDLLRGVYAIVVVDDSRPLGILTDYDTTNFFRDVSEGLIFVEDVEVTLRQYIDEAFDNEHAMEAALHRAFGSDRSDPSRPAQSYDDLSFGQHIQLMRTEGNWEKFEGALQPKALFVELMSQVGQIRNQLAHFRGRLEPIQLDALRRARDWLAARPRQAPYQRATINAVDRAGAETTRKKPGAGKYDALRDYLVSARKKGKTHISLSLDDIEDLIGQPLPEAARDHRSFWDNRSTSIISIAWMRAGWLVDDVNAATGQISFRSTRRAYYLPFFTDLLNRLKSQRPGITGRTKASHDNWFSFSGGKTGFEFSWVLPRDSVLRVELYIDVGDHDENKEYFDKLFAKQPQIEGEIGERLNWDRLDAKRASRISAQKPIDLAKPDEELEPIKTWGVDMMIRFVDAFQSRIAEL